MKTHRTLSVMIAVALPFSVLGDDQDAVSADQHFDPLGKPPPENTLRAISTLKVRYNRNHTAGFL
jgi:hypothetical protein